MRTGRWDKLRRFRRQFVALILACFSKDTPWTARLFMLGAVIYAISPIDLVPDVIPVLGQLDDLTLLAVGLLNVRRLIPQHVMGAADDRVAYHASRAGGWAKKLKLGVVAMLILVPAVCAIGVGVLASWLLTR